MDAAKTDAHVVGSRADGMCDALACVMLLHMHFPWAFSRVSVADGDALACVMLLSGCDALGKDRLPRGGIEG